ncbi:hypothetical protein DRW03_20630 [Corallococcus sp. H22C18031201]|nr:hypothetical protein DRW03_20630 [Corallococcus sp. H22C18031201]
MPPNENARPGQDANSSEAILQECEALEALLAALRNSYEQYFLGTERQAPTRAHDDLKKRLLKLKGAFIRSTAAKFRAQSLHNKYLTYERLWARTLQEMEAGTYRRDIFKARRRADARKGDATGSTAARKGTAETTEELSDLDYEEVEELAGRVIPNEPKLAVVPTPVAPVAPTVAPVRPAPVAAAPVPAAPVAPAVRGMPTITASVPPVAAAGAPVARPPASPPGMAAKPPAVAPPASAAAPRPVAATAAPRPPATSASGGMSDDKLRAVYDAYVTAKRRCQEDTSKLSFESVAATLRKQVPELLKQHNAKAVEFKVVIKDGKASLKAVPK